MHGRVTWEEVRQKLNARQRRKHPRKRPLGPIAPLWHTQADRHREAPKMDDRYEPCAPEEIPEGIRWKPTAGGRAKLYVKLFSIGNVYMLVRTLETGAVTYFKLKKIAPSTPAEKIDAEPVRKRTRFDTGVQCWLVVDDGRWFLVEILAPKQGSIVMKSVTGWDADRQVEWRYGPVCSIPVRQRERLYPLSARRQ